MDDSDDVLFKNEYIMVHQHDKLTIIRCMHDGEPGMMVDFFPIGSGYATLALCPTCAASIKSAYLEELFKQAIKKEKA
jgi:hypothetical protein